MVAACAVRVPGRRDTGMHGPRVHVLHVLHAWRLCLLLLLEMMHFIR